jgi:hypothetical protein
LKEFIFRVSYFPVELKLLPRGPDMGIKPGITADVPDGAPSVTIKADAISFSAKFVEVANLEQAEWCQLIEQDSDDCWVGFKFSEGERPMDSLRFELNGSAGKSRIVQTGAFVNGRPLLGRTAQKERRESTFEMTFDRRKEVWFTRLRPTFERMALYENISSIPSEAKGVYRYLDVNDELLYLGKGNIRDCLASRGRDEWGIRKIEFSIIANDEDSLRWMHHYVTEYRSNHGEMPAMKRIRRLELP